MLVREAGRKMDWIQNFSQYLGMVLEVSDVVNKPLFWELVCISFYR